MEGELQYRYRFEYRTLFGPEFTEFTAASDDDAERMFWATRNPELNRISVVSKSLCDEEGDDGADGGDEDRPSDGTDSADDRFPNEVFSGGRDVEPFPVMNDFLCSGGMDGHAGGWGVCKRIEHLVRALVGKHH